MAIKIYKGVGSGENLYKAICDTGYGCNDPPLVSDWIESQHEAYMEKDWDNESIREYMDNRLINSELDIFFDILVEHKIDIDDVWLGEINRDDLKKWSEEYTDGKKEVCEHLLKILHEDLEDTSYSKNSRYSRAYDKAYDDFNIFVSDIDTDDDDQVREFFGITAEVEGYEIDGEEFDLSEVFICPYCNEARPIKEQKEDFEYENEEYDSSTFYCNKCQSQYGFKDVSFREHNKHISTEELISRCV